MTKSPLVAEQPRYLQIARSLLAELESGRYPVGSRIPNELELCKEFGASRFTVRAAMERLAQAGVVSRKTGIGTTVLALVPRPRGDAGVARPEGIHRFDARTVLEVLRSELATVAGGTQSPLDAHAGETWLHVEALRHAVDGGGPVCFSEIWVGPDYRGVKGLRGRVSKPVSLLIEEQYGAVIDFVRQDLRATRMKPRAARALGLGRGRPSLHLRRAYHDRTERLVQLVLSWYPPDRFVYSQQVGRTHAEHGTMHVE